MRSVRAQCSRSAKALSGALTLALLTVSCGGAGSSSTPTTAASTSSATVSGSCAVLSSLISTQAGACASAAPGAGTLSACASQASSAAAGPGSAPALPSTLQAASGFSGSTIAQISGARELAALPNGDLLVGTTGSNVMIVPAAESAGAAGTPKTFVTLQDKYAEGVAFGPDCNVYVATTQYLWKVSYQAGSLTGTNPQIIAKYRQGSVAPNTDGDIHTSASVAVSSTTIYIGIGSSCGACVEVDPTRATIQQLPLGGGAMTTAASRIRNAVALAIDPTSNHLWAAGAGQDNLAYGHPYEFADDVSSHAGTPDYGWPDCEENRHAYTSGANCSSTVTPLVEFTAYATHIGAVFYPLTQSGSYAFPSTYRGALFIADHGSFHCCAATPPRVSSVLMNGDTPQQPVNWTTPTTQWQTFFSDSAANTSSANWNYRFTGVAVGPQGSLFVADDKNGAVYRIRPGS